MPGRRRFLALAGRAFALLLALPGVAWAQEKALAIHEATRNTLTGAIGVRLRRFFGDRPRPFKPYPDAPRTSLPRSTPARLSPVGSLAEVARGYRTAPGFTGKAISLATLARLLGAANGVTGRRGDVALRAAPSAGALYAGEVYVVVEHVQGLAPGLYYYAPLSGRTGELALLKPGSRLGAVAGALEAPARARGAAAAVLLTNVFSRYRWRYANRGYRYALIDSGHIGENLRLAATSAGLGEWGPLRFEDDRLNELLGIDGLDEAVCALHLLGAPADGAPPADSRRLVEATAGGALPGSDDDAPDRYHAATKLVPATGAGSRAGAAPSTDSASASAGTPAGTGAPAAGESTAAPVPLAARDDPGLSVEQAIRQRRSARGFEPRPVSAGNLGFVLDAAIGHAALRRSGDVELLLFVHRPVADPTEGVARLRPGLYRARAGMGLGAPSLELVRAGDLSRPLVDACLGQDKAGRAAVGFAMVGRVAAAARAGGDRSYRDLCLESGSIAQRVYVAAESVGIAARNLAAYVDEELNALAGLDGHDEAVLHLTMLGPGD